MRLARALQFRTVEDMQDELSAEQIHEWIAFDILENEPVKRGK